MIKRAKAETKTVAAPRAGTPLRDRLLRGSALSASLLALALTVNADPVRANPEGGMVVAGDAVISSVDAGSIQVDQGSDRVVIDWQSFSIDENESVDFNQPGSTSIALNRVTGFDTSYIDGVLTADGYVFLVNPNGVIFGASALVDVGGLVATTADITNENFMAGNFSFDIASANQAAMVANLGSITVAEAGLAALVAPTVRNSGIIAANLGTVQLAGAQSFTLDFYGDGLFSFDTGAVVTAGPDDGGALVENAGTISAAGGHVFITAQGAEEIINNAINMDGVIEAETVGLDQGTIVLSGGEGDVDVSGTLMASGNDAGESGGSISVTGDNVVIADSAGLDTSADISGDGGTVYVWGEATAVNQGAIAARGGAESGDGGFVEISGKGEVILDAGVDLAAPNGAGGTLFIDPIDLVIVDGSGYETTLDGGGNVIITADNDITINDSIDGSTATTAGGSITIASGRSTTISGTATVATNDGDITILVNDGTNGQTLANRSAGTAAFTNDGVVDSNGGTVTIGNGSFSATADVDFALGSIVSGGGAINVNNTVDDVLINTGTLDGGGGNISVTSTGDITVGDGAGTAIDASAGGNVALDAGGNIVDGVGVIDMSGGGTLTLDAAGAVGSNAAIRTSGTFSVDGSTDGSRWYVTNSGGTVTVGDISALAGYIDFFNLGTNLVTGTLAADSFVYLVSIDSVVSGSISADTIRLTSGSLDLQSALTATDFEIFSIFANSDLSIEGGATLDLTNTELGFLNGTGTVTFGNLDNDTLDIGAGADISSLGYDLVLAAGGTITFDDSATSLIADVGQSITLDAPDILGGGTNTDVAFTGGGTGNLNFDGDTVALDVDGAVVLDGTATGAVTYINDGDLTIAGLEGTTIDVDVTGDTLVETGTIVAGGDLTLTSSGTITVGDGAGTAIDASGGIYDVALDAGEDIVDGGGIIDMSGGGTLTLDAVISVGASGAAIETSGSYFLTGSSDDGDFYVDNSGGTLTVQDVVSAGVGTIGNLRITNADDDIDVEGTVLADGDATVDAGTGTIAVSGTLTANVGAGITTGDTATLIADDMDITGAVGGGNITIAPSTGGRDVALNDSTGSTLNLTNAELANLSTTGTVQIGQAGTGDVYVGGDGSVDVTAESWAAATVNTTGTIFVTNGIETADTDVTLDGNVELTGNTLIDTVNGGSGANVSVTGTIEGTTSGAETLTVTGGTGDITFVDQAGQTTPLGSLALTGNNITVTDIATDGSQTYTATGEVTFGSDYTTNGNPFSLVGGLTLADDVLVDTSILAGTGANITIDDVTNDGYTLTLDAGSDGNISLASWTNTGAFDGLGTLNITDSDNTTISGTVSGDTLEVTDSQGEIFLLGDVDLDTLLFNTGTYAVTITGSNVFLVDQVTFNNSGDVTLGDNSGDVFVFTGGVDATNGGVLVSGDFSFSGTGLVASSLSLNGDTTLATDASMLLGDVFGNGYTLNLDGETTGDITLATFQNAVGTGQLHLIDADEFLATGAVTAGTVDIDTAQTSVIFEGMVTATDLIVGAGSYLFGLIGGADITNFVTFFNTGGVQLGDDAGDTTLLRAGATSTASETTLAGLIASEGGILTFDDIILAASTILRTDLNTPSGADINIQGTVDSAPATSQDLTIFGGTGSTTTITGNVGDTDSLDELVIAAQTIVLHDVTTDGQQLYNTTGGGGVVHLNSFYQTSGAQFFLNGNAVIGDDATVDTTAGGIYTTGNILFGSPGSTVSFDQSNGTLTLISGGYTSVRASLAGSLADTNSLSIISREFTELFGGTLGEDLTINAGAFDGNLVHTPLSNITFQAPMTIGDLTDLTATGDVTFLGEFNTYGLMIRLNGLAQSFSFSPVNIEEDLSVGGLTPGEGMMDLVGSIRGVDSDQAAAFGDQLETERRDDILFNGCIVEVGCLNFDPSAIVIPVFDPVIYLYEREGIDEELRYSDLPNTEIWYRLGGAPDIWEERLGTSDDDDEEDNGGDDDAETSDGEGGQ